MTLPYKINPNHDTDLVDLEDWPLRSALMSVCKCGHARHEHYGATGSIASFGGSACGQCWVCATYVRDVAVPVS